MGGLKLASKMGYFKANHPSSALGTMHNAHSPTIYIQIENIQDYTRLGCIEATIYIHNIQYMDDGTRFCLQHSAKWDRRVTSLGQ